MRLTKLPRLVALGIITAGCSTTGVTSTPITLESGAKGYLIKPCPSSESCAEFARSKCANGYVTRNQHTHSMTIEPGQTQDVRQHQQEPTIYMTHEWMIECHAPIAVKPTTLQNGQPALLIDPCKSIAECHEFARSQCPGGYFDREERVFESLTAASNEVVGRMYGLAIQQCQEAKAPADPK
jgi:hypothetical protein